MTEQLPDQTVLIVDDTETNLDILVECLGDDYDVAVAMDGPSCLETVAETPPDLILLDIMMPGMDGYEVCQRLKSEAATRDIPVIFVTALGEITDETRGLELGAVDYITKPVSAPIVLARVKTHLTLARQRALLAAQNAELMEAARLREDVEHITRHDLKSPLSGVIGFAQLLKLDKSLSERQLRSVQQIEDAGYRILSMVNRSLDLFKMERGTYVLQPAEVDIMQVLQQVGSELAPIARATGAQLDIASSSSTDHAATVLGENLLCHSLFANLIKNALEASPQGGRVQVSTAGEKTGWAVSIHNQGAVPSQIRDRFFDKFSTAGKSGGTGLGTYSAKLITETQQGIIRLETNEASGTTITVVLPAAHAADTTASPPEPSTEPALKTLATPLKVLVADDDEQNRRLLARYLEHDAIHTDIVSDGQAAVQAAATIHYDVILLDLEMPLLNGMEAARRIRDAESRDPGQPAARLIALSAHDDETTRTRCREAGIDTYLMKPVGWEQLFAAVTAGAASRDAAWTVAIDVDLRDLVPEFLEAQRRDVAAMRDAMNHQSHEEIRACCHKLKGTARMYGFVRLSELADAAELAASEAASDEVDRALAELADYLKHVDVQFQEM